MTDPLQVFTEGRTHSAWLPRAVEPTMLKKIYDLVKLAPTSANSQPLRIEFVTSPEGKAKLLTAVAAGNLEKTRAAPVTAIFAYDLEFYEKLPKLYPPADARSWFAGNPELIQTTAFRSATLQAGYFMLAARMHGLDCGPMSGFDNSQVDSLFFADTKWKSNFLCNLGYGDASKLHSRLPRLDFDEACRFA